MIPKDEGRPAPPDHGNPHAVPGPFGGRRIPVPPDPATLKAEEKPAMRTDLPTPDLETQPYWDAARERRLRAYSAVE